ncbi:MAG: alpha-glucan family phosphorylase, partial [Chlorobi bacterium]|nr:alpha-glucan family phosphorylase [Chlorobiota bacterium]
RYGYFKQSIQPDGWQQESYPSINPGEIPVELVVDESGNPVTAEVEIAHSKVTFHAWRINVGRVTIYLLDTDRPENELHHRDITAHVYGGDSTTRIMQEIVLGIGGVRFLRKIGVEPGVFHMNEGHPAFLTVELLREKITEGLPREEAQAWVKNRCTFTTHTPVPAGHDRFSPDMMEYIMAGFLKSLDMDMRELMSFGRVRPDNPEEPFCMTVLALKLSRAANGVSELHGRVSREMWKDVFNTDNPDQVPIGHVTNGVHSLGWMTNRTRNFWQRHLGSKWIYYLKNPIIWEQVSDSDLISDEEIWAFRYALRRDLIEFVRRKLKSYYQKQGTDFSQVADKVLSPDVLTIGFARRFATYKRAPLLFRYLDKVLPLFTDEKRPIQIIFAGKAHPRDDAGKRYIQEIVGYTKNPLLFGRVVFLENYDINIARHMISGVDVWLNTPRRPLEASGTSGMKIAVHGGINCSILDGWWREGYSGDNGFAIGDDGGVEEPEKQDEIDAANLLKVLTEQVIPEFYDRDETGIPRKWIQRMRRSMTSLIPMFNTDRMVAEYVQKYYLKR